MGLAAAGAINAHGIIGRRGHRRRRAAPHRARIDGRDQERVDTP
jgi:hypothetical protein